MMTSPLPLFAALCLTSSIACAQNPIDAQSPRAPSVAHTPDAGVLIDGESYAELQSLPNDFMRSAQTAFQAGKYAEAASDLQTAARLLRLGAVNESHAMDSQMRTTAHHLDKIVGEIRSGALTSARQLDQELARAMYDKSNADRTRAVGAWTRQQARRAGYELNVAADEIEKASNWSGHKMEAGTAAAIQSSRDISAKLVSGTNYTKAEVAHALDQLGSTITKVGQRLAPDKSATPSTAADQPASDDSKK